MMLDKTVVPLSTAAEVSSHDDSMDNIYSFIVINERTKIRIKKIYIAFLLSLLYFLLYWQVYMSCLLT